MNIDGNWMNFAFMDNPRVNGSGNAIQHLHYLPFGEDWVDQRNSSWNAPYTFSGKEKDVETGYGYFGARYYDSGLSIWLSVDPMSDKYPSMSPYNYCANNPVILVDPDGREINTDIIKTYGTKVHIEDGSNAVLRETGSGATKHLEFSHFDQSQNGSNEVNFTTVVQEQQKMNDNNPDLQEKADGSTYCNIATQNILNAVTSATQGQNDFTTPGRANSMIDEFSSGTNNNIIEINQTQADQYANGNNPGVIVVGYRNPNTNKSGHVATYSAGTNRLSGQIANIGPSAYTGFVSLNQAISSSKPKQYFLIVPGYVAPVFEVRGQRITK